MSKFLSEYNPIIRGSVSLEAKNQFAHEAEYSLDKLKAIAMKEGWKLEGAGYDFKPKIKGAYLYIRIGGTLTFYLSRESRAQPRTLEYIIL